MNYDMLEAYVVTLIEQIMTGDHTGWEAINKFRAFCNDCRKSVTIKSDKDLDEENIITQYDSKNDTDKHL